SATVAGHATVAGERGGPWRAGGEAERDGQQARDGGKCRGEVSPVRGRPAHTDEGRDGLDKRRAVLDPGGSVQGLRHRSARGDTAARSGLSRRRVRAADG